MYVNIYQGFREMDLLLLLHQSPDLGIIQSVWDDVDVQPAKRKSRPGEEGLECSSRGLKSTGNCTSASSCCEY